jgi:hypothetical protein
LSGQGFQWLGIHKLCCKLAVTAAGGGMSAVAAGDIAGGFQLGYELSHYGYEKFVEHQADALVTRAEINSKKEMQSVLP